MERGLTAFETVERDPAPCGLTLAAARRGLAFARADTAPDPFRLVMRPGIVPDLVELHCVDYHQSPVCTPPSPLAHDAHEMLDFVDHAADEGVSSSTRRRRSLLSPSPFSV